MLTAGMRVGVAVSGGADSVCLLHALMELAPRWDLRLSVLHLDHGLRGEESRADAEFVRELATRAGLPAVVRNADLGVSGNLEQAARAARLAFFRESMARGAADRVATGHTRSDQAETVLYRLLRGAGSAGLAGIRPVTADGIIRPLIDVDREEVLEYLRARSIAWREDSTNAGSRFARNRIRHQLLPQLARDWNPAIVETLAHMADWAQAEEAWWGGEMDRLAGACLQQREGAVVARAETFTSLPLAAARRLIRRSIEMAKGDLRGIDFRHIAEVLALASRPEGRGRRHLPGLEIQRSFEWMRFSRPGAEGPGYRLAASVPGVLRPPAADFAISMELVEKSGTSDLCDCVYNSGMPGLDWHKLSGSLELRNWRPGDQYRPANGAGEEKIKILFQQARVPAWERRQWPVLTDGGSIVWTRRFGAAARYAADAQSKMILLISEMRCT